MNGMNELSIPQYILDLGYTQIITSVRDHEFGATELCMHCKLVGKKAVVAMVRPGKMNYAFVQNEDGVWTQGIFHLFDSGDFSLS